MTWLGFNGGVEVARFATQASAELALMRRDVESIAPAIQPGAAEVEASLEEYRRNFGESERDAAVRDTNHVLEIRSQREDS